VVVAECLLPLLVLWQSGVRGGDLGCLEQSGVSGLGASRCLGGGRPPSFLALVAQSSIHLA